jgi:hypothetical protein
LGNFTPENHLFHFTVLALFLIGAYSKHIFVPGALGTAIAFFCGQLAGTSEN